MSLNLSPLSPAAIMLAMIVLSTVLLFTIASMTILFFYFQRILATQEVHLKMMQDDLSALCNGAVGIGEHLTKLDSRTRDMKKRQENMELQEPPETSYREAIRLVRNGADIDQLMSDCGLAHGEAELAMLVANMEN